MNRFLSPEGRCERTLPMGSTWRSFQFILHWWTKMGGFKNTNVNRPFSNCRKTLLSGWMGGWVAGDFFGPLISSKSSVIRSKMCWFQIWPQKLSKGIRSNVMRNLSLKMLRAISGAKIGLKNDGHKRPLLVAQIEESFQKKIIEKKGF